MSATSTRPVIDAADSAVLGAIWAGLAVLLLAGTPALAGLALAAWFAAGGAPLLVPLVVVAVVGPGGELLCATARNVVDRNGRVTELPRLLVAGAVAGAKRAVPIAVPALLACLNLALLGKHVNPVLDASLAVNAVALGCALFVAPFAYVEAALGERGIRASWRAGAGTAASSPGLVLSGLCAAVLAGIVTSLVGPVFLVALPGPAAALLVSAIQARRTADGVEIARLS